MSSMCLYANAKTTAQLHSCISIHANFSTQSQSRICLDAQHLPLPTFHARPTDHQMKCYLRHWHHRRVCHLIKKKKGKRREKAVLMNLSRVLQSKKLESYFNFHVYVNFELDFVFSYFELCIAVDNMVNSLIRTNKVLIRSCLHLPTHKHGQGKSMDQVVNDQGWRSKLVWTIMAGRTENGMN